MDECKAVGVLQRGEEDDDERKSIVQLFLEKSNDYSRRVIVPVGDRKGVTLSRESHRDLVRT